VTKKAKTSATKPQGKANRLIDETSTYLQQHAYNPVNWYPWGAEAIGKAKAEDKPILLSIGYAACHWCHVMAHESFEDAATAQIMNEYFVNIKVDREERTDLDEIYMKAVQMMSGHGGWPMTVVLTPEMKPFFGGTYFPPEDKHGLPGFKKLLKALADAWKEQRDDITESSNELTVHLKAMDKVAPQPDAAAQISQETIEQALLKLLPSFDQRWGGFGNAPKFPHTFSLSLAMRYLGHGKSKNVRTQCTELIQTTLDRMAYGGIQDHIAGGFSRYSVDRQWLIPHFEKMLYDNALLAQVYLDGWLLLRRDYWQKVARGIFEFVLTELRTEGGGFYSSLDADSEGEEGKFYGWTEQELKAELLPPEYSFVTEVFGISQKGNFEHGTNVFHLDRSPEESAKVEKLTEGQFWTTWEPIRLKLLSIRNKRVRPGRDEKVLTSWNSLMINALVSGYRVLGDDDYLEAAKAAANFIFENLMPDGRLLRTWGRGHAKINGYLDDYAFFVEALIEMASVDDDPKWLVNAIRLTDEMLEKFWDEREGGLFYTANDHEELVTRPKSFYDGSIPSGSSVATQCLLKLAKLSGKENYQKKAEQLLELYAPYSARHPDQFANLLCAMDFHLDNGPEIVCLENGSDKFYPDTAREHVLKINDKYIPNKVVLIDSITSGAESSRLAIALKQELSVTSPLLTGRDLQEGKPTVYICRNFSCDKPITNMNEVESKVTELASRVVSKE
jgi:uncharacterized protein